VDYPGLPVAAPIGETPIRFSKTPAGIRHRAPTLGEHTDKIMKELGYTESDIASLRQRRVI
jgi:crotonobetainyl-CoA:carnitine CoA-transferase CaiB-like acyl-CoA transferase